MERYIIAYDFGTGGIKASLHAEDGVTMTSAFCAYQTFYPHNGWHEQRPADWWQGMIDSTGKLLAESKIDKNAISGLAISGHSLGVVPVGADGALLREYAPIWSDTRAQEIANKFFETHDRDAWYIKTGNGFPSHLYSVFKLMWYQAHEPEMFSQIRYSLGTKDYINYLLTGVITTDYSYASGCGAYDLKKEAYDFDLVHEMGLPVEIFPEIVPSTQVLGELTAEAAKQTGLPRHVKVMCGGVDNSCMALGARGIVDGRAYTSLGSSSWIAVSSNDPILDHKFRPYVFAHIIPHMFISSTAIFASGSSFRWVRDQMCKNLLGEGLPDAYSVMNELAASAPIGANKLLFNPSLAGGSSLDATPNVRGAFIGLDLKHAQADIIRSTMEGIAMALCMALDRLKEIQPLSNEMLIVGGGGKSDLWRQMFADIYGMDILKTSVGQDAGSLGAAAVAAVGLGMWKDFTPLEDIHKFLDVHHPRPEALEKYERLFEIYQEVTQRLYSVSDRLYELDI